MMTQDKEIDAAKSALECLVNGAMASLYRANNNRFEDEKRWVEKHKKTILAALEAYKPVDVEGLRVQLVDYLVEEYGFSNPNNDAQKLALLCCDMWTHHLIERGVINAK